MDCVAVPFSMVNPLQNNRANGDLPLVRLAGRFALDAETEKLPFLQALEYGEVFGFHLFFPAAI